MLSAQYAQTFDELLKAVAHASTDLDARLVPFWPLVGAAYASDLLVVGRSVNGWVSDWSPSELRDLDARAAAVRWMRSDAEIPDGDRMAWVSDLWGNRAGYNTARSAFWRVLRRVVSGDTAPMERWPSTLTWTNLYKVSPAAGWNPGADLQRAQRELAIELLRLELDELQPRRVLALTGRGWLRPFSDALGLRLAPGPGLVEAVGRRGDEAWVVAKHPMGKPESAFVEEVLEAFDRLRAPLRPRGDQAARS